MTYAYVTNNCGNLSFYFDENREYDHPFIGSLFMNDWQFLKVCQNFEHYLRAQPTFGTPNESSVWAQQNQGGWYKHEEITPPYPVMYLHDLEIHWIHEKSESELLTKFLRRVARYWEQKPTPVFLWGDCDLMNDHPKDELKKLVKDFAELPKSIYLTRYRQVADHPRVYFIERWENVSHERNYSHIPLIHEIGDRIEDYKDILRNKDPFSFREIVRSQMPRIQDIPVQNPYRLVPSRGDYTVNVYYLSEHKCYVFVSRHDAEHGWGFLELQFDDTGEQIELRSSQDSAAWFVVETETKLEPMTDSLYREQLIPKVIVQTAETNECKSSFAWSAHRSILEANPEYEYVFFTDIERRQFIKENFTGDTLRAYDTLVPGAYRADLFRYCYLYVKGGCYLDFKMIERVPLRDIIKPTDDLLVCVDYERSNSRDRSVGTSYLNAIIFAAPQNPLLMEMIQMCGENILGEQERFLQEARAGGCSSILDITGPTLLYKCMKGKVSDSQLRFKHVIENNDETRYGNFGIIDLEQARQIFTKTHQNHSPTNHYSELWNKGELFYRDRREMGDWIAMVYPHPFPDQYSFDIVNDHTLRVLRSANQGWWNELRVKLINNRTSDVHMIDVGRHHTGVKDVFLPDILTAPALPANVFTPKRLACYKPSVLKLEETVVAVPSVIHVSDNPILEFASRSVFTSKERYDQTVGQLRTIREKIPNSTVILLEASTFTQAELEDLSGLYDYVILYNDEEAYEYCHRNFSNKGLGEMYVMCQLCSVLQHNKDFKYLCKFGGRYPATKDFDITPFLQDVPVAHVIPGGGKLQTSRGVVNALAYCLFYCLPRKYLELYYHHFKVWLDPSTTEPVEHVFTMFLQALRRVEVVDKLNIEGYGAAKGNYILL